MSVILNEPAIARLFNSFPFVREAVDKQAERARDALQFRIDGIISNPANRPLALVEFTQEGAIVGIRDEAGARTSGRESISEYLDFKLGVQEPWWDDVGEAAARGA